MLNISCIIPAYNEGKRVLAVINAVLRHENIDEVIVVNDGSSDDTEAVLKEVKGIELISYPKNGGKSHAIMMGFKKAKNDLVLMLDADLIGLDKESISALIKPVLNNEADISLSLRSNSLGIYKLLGLDFITGERCFNKNTIGDLNRLDKIPGFGLETFLNKIFIAQKTRIKVVNWKNVRMARKSDKVGTVRGFIGDLKMIYEICTFFGWINFVKIFFQMMSLKLDTN